jgi:SpoVK/Ycf46/Vps4 family AAA+-type ATPase
MPNLITSLDNINNNEEINPETVQKLKLYSNSLYDKCFNENYTRKFKSYFDPDKCNDGFLGNKPLLLKKKHISIDVTITSLKDLYTIPDNYPISLDIDYDIDIKPLHNIKNDLQKLDAFIGLEELKENVLDQITYFMYQSVDDYLHTVLYGPPGTGKTEIAKILGNIYTKLGILKKGTFTKVTRGDFIAGYLGQTALKTRKLIEENLGGVIFIDEAYAMGNNEKRDMFSKEAIDTLCELLSEHKNELMVIIAGYEKELDECFFSYNPGLKSRFAWRFEIKKYNEKELMKIFHKKVTDAGWKIENNVGNEEWFKKNLDLFKNYGRDMENLFSKIKIKYFRKRFGKKIKELIIKQEDLDIGLESFKKYYENQDNENKTSPSFMYS